MEDPNRNALQGGDNRHFTPIAQNSNMETNRNAGELPVIVHNLGQESNDLTLDNRADSQKDERNERVSDFGHNSGTVDQIGYAMELEINVHEDRHYTMDEGVGYTDEKDCTTETCVVAMDQEAEINATKNVDDSRRLVIEDKATIQQETHYYESSEIDLQSQTMINIGKPVGDVVQVTLQVANAESHRETAKSAERKDMTPAQQTTNNTLSSENQAGLPQLEKIIKVEMEKTLTVSEQSMVIQGMCNDFEEAEIVQIISDLVFLFLSKRNKDLSEFVQKDFVEKCFNAIELLYAEKEINILYLLAKALTTPKDTTDSNLLSLDSTSFNFIQMMLLSLLDTQENKTQMKQSSTMLTTWLTEARKENPKFLKYTNRVLFPLGNCKFRHNKVHNKILLDTSVQTVPPPATVTIQIPQEVSTADLKIVVLSGEQPHLVVDAATGLQVQSSSGNNSDIKEPLADGTKKKISKLRCKHCGIKFPTKADARQHEQSKACLTCNHCESVHESRQSWLDHIMSHQNKNLHICHMCGKGFARKENLQRHVKSVHEGIKPYRCPVCNNTFTEKNSLEEHVRIHTGEKPFMCELCNERFRTRGLFRRHVAFSHGNGLKKYSAEDKGGKSHACEQCGRQFPRKSNLEKHIKTVHERVKAFACLVCGNRFTEKASLDEHIRIHTGEKPFQCEHCEEKFRTRSLYRRHVAFKHMTQTSAIKMKPRIIKRLELISHPTGVTYESNGIFCDTCGKNFKRKSNLAHHIKTVHEGIKPFECPTCGSRFSEKKILQDHIRLHTGEKPFTCPQCPEKFRTGEMYRKHIAAQHGFLCNFCQTKFNNASSLNRHQKLQHSDRANLKSRFKCFQCSKTFMFRYQRERHIQLVHRGIKNYACEICGKKFSTSAHMNEHLPVHNREPRFICKQCGQGFIHRASYKRHVIRHLGLQQFPCPVCNKRFDSPDYAKNHVKRVHKDVQVQMLDFEMPGTSLPPHLRKRQTGGRKPNHELGSFNTSMPKIITNYNPNKNKPVVTCTEAPKPRKQRTPPKPELIALKLPLQEVTVTTSQVQIHHEILQQPDRVVEPQVIVNYDPTPSVLNTAVNVNQPNFPQAWGQYPPPAMQMQPQMPQAGQNLQLLRELLDNSGESRVINVPADVDFMQFGEQIMRMQDGTNR